jgi:hypothetical protein
MGAAVLLLALGGKLLLGVVILLGVLLIGAIGVAIPGSMASLLRIPAVLAGPTLARAFPQEGSREYSMHLRVLRVEVSPGWRAQGGGIMVNGKVLVLGLPGFQLDWTLRVRTPEGGYLRAVLPEVRGIYGELRGTFRGEVFPCEQAEAREFSLQLSGFGGDTGGKVGGFPVAVEVLVSCEGEMLAEIDLPGEYLVLGEKRGDGPALVAKEFPVERDPAAIKPPANVCCALCGDPVLHRIRTCRSCHHVGHLACWDFTGVCPGCGVAGGG